MNSLDWLETGMFLLVLLALAKPLGDYLARVYQGQTGFPTRVFGPLEQRLYRLCGVDPTVEMNWRAYALAVLVFNGAGFAFLYLLLRLQGWLPLNPEHMPAVSPALAFNIAASFATNTNWQSYGGETTLSYLTQMVGLSVQNFVSAASGLAVMVALIRGFIRREKDEIGNFWVDLTRSVLYVLLPLAIFLAVALASQGVVQTFKPYVPMTGLEKTAATESGGEKKEAPGEGFAKLALGPAASQVAIKQLGTNGGGFFNANSAHPFENPNPFANFLELLAILLIPAACCHTFGRMVGDTRQGWLLLGVMVVIFTAVLALGFHAERNLPDKAWPPGLVATAGNLEGKEVRFGVTESVLWATATTAASNGSTNAAHDSFTPLGVLGPMWLMQLGEVVFGGVGSGLYGMLAFALIAVFVAGLMVGRTPEYLGKKIGAHETKMATLVILIPIFCVLAPTAVAVVTEAKNFVGNPGPRAFSEILYAFSSMGNNNGSALAGLDANNAFYNLAGGVAMLVSRYWLMLPVLAIAGSLARKKITPTGAGTLSTHTPLFGLLLIAVITVVGALSFLPALCLGPVVEHLLMFGW